MSRYNESKAKHSTPLVAVQVPDIGMCTPGIVYFCNRPDHHDCCKELENAFAEGGFVVSTSYWAKRYQTRAIKGG